MGGLFVGVVGSYEVAKPVLEDVIADPSYPGMFKQRQKWLKILK